MNIALIMAAGSGKRMGVETPKQFLLVNGEPLMWHTLKAFNDNQSIDAIYIVTNRSYFNKVNELSAEFEKVIDVVEGGETRQESVFNGLKFLKNNGMIDEDIILIHDAARPLVNDIIITNNIVECEKYGAVITSIPANDSLVRSLDNETVLNNENRKEIYQNQTPQTFKLGLILSCYYKVQNDLASYTDDGQIALASGLKIHIVNGSKLNFKVTTLEDLKMFEALKS
ncbi:MAG: 2-C-methyl-D-erythritol 4-phosphate cytidylyltransferase [Bacilli bacterium]|nr:2-C-methyl-D-erythritol 4-phosphate cytidylyltransferase [Bacilli bacterium]